MYLKLSAGIEWPLHTERTHRRPDRRLQFVKEVVPLVYLRRLLRRGNEHVSGPPHEGDELVVRPLDRHWPIGWLTFLPG